MVKHKSSSIIFLMETKSLVTQMDKIRTKLRASCCFIVSFVGRNGGLALLWFESMKLEIVNYLDYHIHSKIKEKSKVFEWFFIGFYGILETSRRSESWHLLGKINHDPSTGWCVLGDFNKITTQDKKIGGRPRLLSQMEAFKLALDSNGLLDLGWKEKKYA